MSRDRKLKLLLAGLIALIFLLAAPAALRSALERGELYLFTSLFFADLAPRLSGPGSLRFVLQPLAALLLGARDGVRDARAGREPYLWALLSDRGRRRELLRSALSSISNLLLVAILLDAVVQWIIFRVVHPGAALVIGPVLISAPYAVARALANRALRGRKPARSPG